MRILPRGWLTGGWGKTGQGLLFLSSLLSECWPCCICFIISQVPCCSFHCQPSTLPTCHRQQAPLLIPGQRKVREAPSLPVHLLSLPPAGGNGPAVLKSLFCGAGKYWLPGKRMGQGKGSPVTAREAGRQNGPTLALPLTHHLLAHLRATQPKPHQAEEEPLNSLLLM